MMIRGADFSTLEEVERCGGKFYSEGRQVDLITRLAECGITSARLRLWLDPFSPSGEPYLGGTCDEKTVMRLSRRAKDCGMSLMLDLHYSDFWCDPGRQCLPKAWQGMNLAGVCSALYDYTARTLDHFDRAGLSPECVQIGNEITNGMLWPLGYLGEGSPRTGYDPLADLLRSGCNAARQSSDASVMLHLERSGNKALWREWLDEITSRDVDFDELGASYYPYWHGTFEEMKENLDFCAARYNKEIRIVETSYAFTGEHYNPADEGIGLTMTGNRNLCADGRPMPFPASPEGQADYTRELIKVLEGLDHGCKGIYWWEPGWLPVNGVSWASRAALAYCGEEYKSLGNEWANQCLFDYSGNELPALSVFCA